MATVDLLEIVGFQGKKLSDLGEKLRGSLEPRLMREKSMAAPLDHLLAYLAGPHAKY